MYKNILVPIAFGHEVEVDTALRASKTLRDEGGKIILLSVLEPVTGMVAGYLPEGVHDKVRAEVLTFLEQLAQKISGNVEAHVDMGGAGQRILEFAEEHACDCIVIRSHKPGLEDYFLGSTAARVVRHAQCSVHVVR